MRLSLSRASLDLKRLEVCRVDCAGHRQSRERRREATCHTWSMSGSKWADQTWGHDNVDIEVMAPSLTRGARCDPVTSKATRLPLHPLGHRPIDIALLLALGDRLPLV